MAATHLHHLMATTIHKQFGLQDGRYDNEQLAQKVLTDDALSKIKENLNKMDVLVVDEVSMLSQKSFDQVDYLLRSVRNTNSAFGGVQLIFSGDFYQLPPIPKPAYGDEGRYCFESPIWNVALPHRVNLDNIHRQNETDLVEAIRQLSQGHADEKTDELLNE